LVEGFQEEIENHRKKYAGRARGKKKKKRPEKNPFLSRRKKKKNS